MRTRGLKEGRVAPKEGRKESRALGGKDQGEMRKTDRPGKGGRMDPGL